MFGCTAKDASTYHISRPSFSAPSTRGLARSFLKYKPIGPAAFHPHGQKG